jgi:hypothetical protein
VHRGMNELRTVASSGGAYVSESNFFESDFEHSYWGANHARLAEIKKKYDPDGLFFVHNGVGSEQWTRDGFTKLWTAVRLKIEPGNYRSRRKAPAFRRGEYQRSLISNLSPEGALARPDKASSRRWLSCLRLKMDNGIGPEPMDQRRNADAEREDCDENFGFDL